MARVHSKWVEGNLVFYDNTHRMRWVDAYGPNVIKWELPRCGGALDDQVGTHYLPTWGVCTVVDTGASSTLPTPGGTLGVGLQVLTAKGEYDGVVVQGHGEPFQLTAGKPLYMGAKFETSDTSKCDLFIGLAETETIIHAAAAHTLHASVDNYVGFWKPSDVAVMKCATEKASSASVATTAGTMVNNAKHTVEVYYDGAASSAGLTYFFDGVQMVKKTAAAKIPTVVMHPTFAFRTGAAAAKTGKLHWMRVIQLDT